MKGIRMMKRTVLIMAVAVLVGSVATQARDLLVRFDGGVGVIPAAAGSGPANADGTLPNVKSNIVRGVPLGAGPWRIADLRADASRRRLARPRAAREQQLDRPERQSKRLRNVDREPPRRLSNTHAARRFRPIPTAIRIDDVRLRAAACASPFLFATWRLWFAAASTAGRRLDELV